MAPRNLSSRPLWLKAVIFGAAYFGCAYASWYIAASDGLNVSFWIPGGLYIAVLLLTEPKEWLALVASATVVNLAFDLHLGTPPGMACVYAVVNTFQSVIGASLFRYFISGEPNLRRIRGFMGLVVCSAFLAAGIGAAPTSANLVRIGEAASFLNDWLYGWTGNAMAILTVAPFVMVWCSPPEPGFRWAISPRRAAEATALVVGMAFVSFYLFVAGGGVTAPDNFVLITFVLWAALRFGVRGASAVNLLLALLLVYFASHYPKGLELSQVSSTGYVTKLYLFLAICSMIGMIPAIALEERDQLVGQLGDSEDRFRKLAAAANEGIIITEHGLVIDVNDQALKLFGYDRAAEMVGMTVAELVTPETRPIVMQAIASDLEIAYAHRLVRRDGTTFDAEAQARVMRSGNRKIRMTALRDVSQRKKEESLLNGQYRVLEMIAVRKPLEEILAALISVIESQSSEMFGSVSVVDGSVLVNIAAPSMPRDFNRAIARIPITERAGSCGAAALRREPVFVADVATNPLWADYTEEAAAHGIRACWSTPIFEGKERLLGTFALYLRRTGLPDAEQRQLIDIATHTASIAISRHQDEAALKLSDFSVNQASTPTFWITQDARIRRVNLAACEMAGYSEEELLARTVSDLMPDFKMEEWPAYWQEARSRRRMRFERQQRGKDGSTKQLDIDMNFFEFEGREYQFFFLHDITDRRQLEEKLRQSQKMEAIGQLSGGIAHDFNNLLTVIQGNIGMIRMSADVPEPVLDSVEEIDTAIERATKLTGQLLAFGRKQVMQSQDVDLNEVVQSFSSMLRRVIGETVDVQLRFSPGALAVRADRSMLEQVMLNLCINARDAMPKGGELMLTTTPATIVAADAERMPGSRPGHFAVLSVTDTGTGITPENLEHLFEPFFTTKEVGKGTGLGLASVYGILQQHHGWVSVHSQLAAGTTFGVYLPLLTREPAAAAAPPKAIAAFPGGDETILLVEDDPAVRLVANKALAMMGYRVIVACNGAEAAEKWAVHRHEIQLLLTDMGMSGEWGGAEIARMFRAQEPELRVIFMSGYSADLAGTDFNSAGGDFFLGKPFEITELAVTLRRCLERLAKN